MAKNRPTAAFDQSDPKVLDRLSKVQRVCLDIVILIAICTLGAWVLTALGFVLPSSWTLMKVNTALAALACAVSLTLSQPHRSTRSLTVSRILALLVALVALLSLVEHSFRISLGVDTLIAADPLSLHPGLMSPQAASSFLMLAIVLLFVRAREGTARHVADLFAVCSSLLILVVVSGYIFGAKSLFRVSPNNWTSPQALLILALLSFVAFGRRTENGAFGILVGRGIGSRIARVLTPILLALPFLREAGRARLLQMHLLPEHYAIAILASIGAAASFVLVILLAWYINNMEQEIQDLTLRDELTRLYNLRGFRLLAEQALHMAKRAQLPFSVLFIDLDDLKQINDQLGHDVGSAFLTHTGELLRALFRETDVVGRIGGDEFAVAGQFSRTGAASAVRRLEAESSLAGLSGGRNIPLSLSIGHVTTGENGYETLDELLAEADKAMYEQKRSKKLQVR